MQNNDKKYFIPVDGTPIEVSEEIYRAYYQPIWNTRYHAQKNGECHCTKAQLWKCDGVCPGCPFYAAGKKVSIDTPIGGKEDELTLGDTLADDAPSAESILMDKELLDTLYDELNRLDPDGRRICELIMQGKTEREIAADMGKRQSTINYQKNKIADDIQTDLKLLRTPSCGAQNMAVLRHILTAAPSSPRCICHRQRSATKPGTRVPRTSFV